MSDEAWCEDAREQDGDILAPNESTGPIEASAGSTAAWLVTSPEGTTMVDIDWNTVSMTVQDFADFCAQGLRMALKGGALPPDLQF